LHRLDSAAPSRSARKVIVLLSDGEHNVPPPALTPRQAAQLSANKGIPIYTIDAGGDTDVDERTEPGTSAPAPAEIRASGIKSLQAVAQVTGGRYFRAHDTQTLLAVCQEIDRLERNQIQSFIYQRYWEGYPWVGLGSFVCWLAILVLETTVWHRLP
jgi:Ca-activated chloride channel family protein